ncbi:MAG: Gfo/Idh/MocA family protein [Candidatus Hodarchaeota archaeon]
MNKLNVGIIGLGTIAENIHIPILSNFEDVNLCAVTDVNIKRSKSISKRWNIEKFYQNHNKMFDDSNLNVVFVCTPNYFHSQIVNDAIEHDIHVFCEKPFGLSSNDAYDLVCKAHKRNLILTVGYNYRLKKPFEKGLTIIQNKRIGKLSQIHGSFISQGPYRGYKPSSDWAFQNESGGALYDIGCHLFDLLTHLSSDYIIQVLARSVNVMSLKIVDNIAGFFKTKKGIIGTFNMGWQAAVDSISLNFYGTGGSLFISEDNIEEIHKSNGSLEKMMNHLKNVKRIVGNTLLSSNKSIEESYIKEDRAFIDAVIYNKNPVVLGEEAVHVLEVLDAIKESLEDEKLIKVYNHFSCTKKS